MANLGYFQLKASPGLWTLDLREGPSKDIFALEGSNNNNNVDKSTTTTKSVAVNSFASVVLKVKVKRNPGKESASLLDSEEAEESQQGNKAIN
jgi:UDP-glucose:glycoprotein glucosyltransferase